MTESREKTEQKEENSNNDSHGTIGKSNKSFKSTVKGLKITDRSGFHPGDSSYENHVFFVGNFGGLKWENSRDYAQEAETGQMAFDLSRHSGLLELGRKIIEDNIFLKKPINGDKDIFRFAHLIMGEPFHFVNHFPGYSFFNHERDCLVHFFGPIIPPPSSSSLSSSPIIMHNKLNNNNNNNNNSNNSDNDYKKGKYQNNNDNYEDRYNKKYNNHFDKNYEIPLFFHQLKNREYRSFNQILRVPLAHRKAPSGCLILGSVPDNNIPKIIQKNRKNHRKNRILQADNNNTMLQNDTKMQEKRESKDNGDKKQKKARVTEITKKTEKVEKIEKTGNNGHTEKSRKTENLMVESGEIFALEIDEKYLTSHNLVEFSKKLFEEVDLNWKLSGSDRMVFWHIGSIANAFYKFVPWFLKKKNNGFL